MAKDRSLVIAIIGIVALAVVYGAIFSNQATTSGVQAATQINGINNLEGAASAAGYYCVKCYGANHYECYYLSTGAYTNHWLWTYCPQGGAQASPIGSTSGPKNIN